MKYPFIIFYRYDKYKEIDDFFKNFADKLECTLYITNKKEKLNNLFKQTYPLLITYGGETNEEYYQDIKDTINCFRTIHISKIESIDNFNLLVNNLYINICSLDRIHTRPIFSIFTPAFNSYEKILRAFKSLQAQIFTNWEWIIVDDSPDDNNFKFLTKTLKNDSRIRIYRRFENNGYIGNVKNEAVSLCRGKYILELDHDDEILPFVLNEAVELFEKDSSIGFIYMDFINIYENGNNFFYGDNICKGYGSYYCQKYNNKWVYVYNTPNINNITLSHLVCCPNHPRIWRRDVLLELGNFCEYLPICDDYEIILRTVINTKIAKISKMGYIQYMNNENNNFSLIRNSEINRIGPYYISPIYYKKFKIHDKMKELNAYEDEKYIYDNTNIWKRSEQYTHNYCNLLVNNDYKKQICIIGFDKIYKNIDRLNELYKDETNDFFVLDNKYNIEYMFINLDKLNFGKMKCYTLLNEPEENLIKYFKICYKSVDNYEIIND